MYYIIILAVIAVACATSATRLVTDGPSVEESTCDFADSCCEIAGERVCCFDDGKRIMCAKGGQLPLGVVD